MGSPAFLGASIISVLAALVLLWILKFQNFDGKLDYAISFTAMIWSLMMVGYEAASSDFHCQMQWATAAWLGNGLLPVAWCYFVCAYVSNAACVKRPIVRAALLFMPLGIYLFVYTNPLHHLVYKDTTAIPLGANYIDYVHGPGFYVIIAALYFFVFATIVFLLRAFTRSRRTAWPLLSMLLIVTVSPLISNTAYVLFGFTLFGLDPTAFMFSISLVPFTWILATNKTMDMAFVGRSVLADTMSEPVIMIDRHRKIVLRNKAAKASEFRLASAQAVDALIDSLGKFGPDENVAQMNIGDRIYEPRIRVLESPLNPSEIILGWSVTFVDITDRIAANSALQEALQRADDANRAKDEFISVVSHELRTPLTSLVGGVALARSGRIGEVSARLYSVLNIAHRNGIRLTRLVDNILLAQKIDIDALTLESERVEITALLEESFNENAMFAKERSIQLVLEDAVRRATIIGDAFAIRQIIDNLVSNAIKFSTEGGIITGALDMSNGEAKLSITNAGQGIPDGMEHHVFGRFEQVANSNQHSTQGSGLGLHISKKLANKMSGDVFYESVLGSSTTFYVTFPVAPQAEAELATTMSPARAV